jgi:hypothetical protein
MDSRMTRHLLPHQKLIDLGKTPMGLYPFAASVRVNKMTYLSAPVLNRKFGGVALL